jgi:hypothetical protein
MSILKESHGRIKETRGDKREVTLIREGWGSSGYYPGEVLERDVPRVFPIGTHMYLDHPTTRESTERPERSVSELVGTIIETPRMAGAESVAVAEVYDHYKPVIDAVADDVGLSIRALGEIEEGSAGGKDGTIIRALTEGISVDYVTQAGAGGRVGALIESAKKNVPENHPAYPEFQAELNQLLLEGDEEKFKAFVKRVAKKTGHSQLFRRRRSRPLRQRSSTFPRRPVETSMASGKHPRTKAWVPLVRGSRTTSSTSSWRRH